MPKLSNNRENKPEEKALKKKKRIKLIIIAVILVIAVLAVIWLKAYLEEWLESQIVYVLMRGVI